MSACERPASDSHKRDSNIKYKTAYGRQGLVKMDDAEVFMEAFGKSPRTATTTVRRQEFFFWLFWSIIVYNRDCVGQEVI
jgi:hypothetical protein